jgi:hypothetical protein
MRALALFLSLCLALPLAAAKAVPATTNQYVSADTRLLAKPSAFGKSVRTLKKGTLVKAEKPRNGYIKVVVPLGEQSVSGYLPLRAVQKSRPKLTTAARKSSDASAEEVAAATKGFNQQVEADLRGSGQDKGFERLDRALARSKVEDPMGQLEGFRKAGQLGEYKEGGE